MSEAVSQGFEISSIDIQTQSYNVKTMRMMEKKKMSQWESKL